MKGLDVGGIALAWMLSFLPPGASWNVASCIPIAPRSSVGQTTCFAAQEELESTKSYVGKDIYQRVFYRFSPGSDVAIHDAIVVEERCRFTVDTENPDYMQPCGATTIILRDGQVQDGEIGDDFFTIQTANVHAGAGTDRTLQNTLATAMYLASNPNVCQGTMLEIACESGWASVLGCVGARFTTTTTTTPSPEETPTKALQDDILTISDRDDGVFPKELESLSLSDVNENTLTTAFGAIQKAVSTTKLFVGVLDWRLRPIRRPGTNTKVSEYKTIVASDVMFTYPEAKELARNIANRLEPSAPYFSQPVGGSGALPQFVYVGPDNNDEFPYLRKILESGYRMNTSTHYLKVEKLSFCLQTLDAGTDESKLDDEELELKDFREINYQCLTAQHHPEYAGEGSGELFFPVETGQSADGSTYLEREGGMTPF